MSPQCVFKSTFRISLECSTCFHLIVRIFQRCRIGHNPHSDERGKYGSVPKPGKILSYQLTLGTKKCQVGGIPFVAHRPHGVPSSIHIAAKAATGGSRLLRRRPRDLRHLPPDQLGAVPKGTAFFSDGVGVVTRRGKNGPPDHPWRAVCLRRLWAILKSPH